MFVLTKHVILFWIDTMFRTNLMTDLMSSVDASFKMYMDSNGQNIEAGLVFRRSMDVLNAIIKEFASVKMPSGIKS